MSFKKENLCPSCQLAFAELERKFPEPLNGPQVAAMIRTNEFTQIQNCKCTQQEQLIPIMRNSDH